MPELEDRVRQRRLRWFGDVRRAEETIVGEVLVLPVEGGRPSGRLKKTWQDCIKEDLEALGMVQCVALRVSAFGYALP